MEMSKSQNQSADTMTAHAVPQANGSKWSMGLGAWSPIANMTAVGLICAMFWQAEQEFRSQAREDRQMFRDELRIMHEDNKAQWKILQEHQETSREILQALKDLNREMRKKPTRPPDPE